MSSYLRVTSNERADGESVGIYVLLDPLTEYSAGDLSEMARETAAKRQLAPGEWSHEVVSCLPPAYGSAFVPPYRDPRDHIPAHYEGDGIQPFDVIDAFGLDFYAGNVLKYLLRHKKKNGKQDLEKARHYLDIMISKWAA